MLRFRPQKLPTPSTTLRRRPGERHSKIDCSLSRLIERPAAPTVLIPLVIGCGLLMQGLEGTAIATALPTMARALGESPVRLNLAISAYMLSVAVCIPISGWMANRFGARNVFCAAMALFALASTLCGLSTSLPQLLAARVLQGVAGALMTPVGRVVILRATPRDQIVKAMSILTVPAVLGPILGPLIGGAIVEAASWRWIFFLSAPVGLAGLIAAVLIIPDLPSEPAGPLDLWGLALAGGGVAALVIALGEVGHPSWPPGVIAGLAALGALSLLAYVKHARSAREPVLDLSLLRLLPMNVVIFGGGLWRAAMGASPLLLVLLLQVGFGLSPLRSGAISFAGAMGSLLMKGPASSLLRRYGFRRVLIVNGALTGILLAGMGLFQASTSHALIFLVLLVGGFFRSLQFTALASLCYADVPDHALGGASALASMTQELAQSLGVALAAVTLQSLLALRHGAAFTARDLSISFFVMGGLSLLSLPLFGRLPAGAGDALSGRSALAAAKA
jgi:EmrB/QacA subfamily drug resistance transporter